VITPEEIKEIYNTNLSDNVLQKFINRSIEFLRGYTNNSKIYDQVDNLELDDVLLYLIIQRLNVLKKAGIEQEKMGEVWITPNFELPGDIKVVLGKYRRAKFL
jgi:hypothetical protein